MSDGNERRELRAHIRQLNTEMKELRTAKNRMADMLENSKKLMKEKKKSGEKAEAGVRKNTAASFA